MDERWITEDRITLFFAAVVYPLWALVHLQFPEVNDSVSGRIWFGLPAALWLALSYRSAWVRQYLTYFTLSSVTLITAHFFYVAYSNDMHRSYSIGSFVVVAAITTSFHRTSHFIFYGVITTLMAWLGSGETDPKLRVFYCLGLFTALSISFLGTYRRLIHLQRERELQEKMTEQQAQLAAASKLSSLGEVAGGIAHEINTPLAIIQMRAEQLREAALEGGVIERSFILDATHAIEATASRVTKIVRGLRTFARETSADPFSEFPVEQIVGDVLLLCETKIRSHQIHLEVNLGEKGLTVECRPVQIGQVLLNLIQNALDAVSRVPSPKIRITIEEVGARIRFVVQDNGEGISAQARAKLFQPFFTTKEVGKGTGLGLSISKGIIDQHQGTLKLEESACGARFVISLPKHMAA